MGFQMRALVVHLPARLVRADKRLGPVLVREGHRGGQKLIVIWAQPPGGRKHRNDGHGIALDESRDDVLVGLCEHHHLTRGKLLTAESQGSHAVAGGTYDGRQQAARRRCLRRGGGGEGIGSGILVSVYKQACRARQCRIARAPRAVAARERSLLRVCCL